MIRHNDTAPGIALLSSSVGLGSQTNVSAHAAWTRGLGRIWAMGYGLCAAVAAEKWRSHHPVNVSQDYINRLSNEIKRVTHK